MPQHSGGIFIDANISSHVDCIIFYHGLVLIFPMGSKELAELGKSCKSPIALIDVKSVIRSYLPLVCMSAEEAKKGAYCDYDRQLGDFCSTGPGQTARKSTSSLGVYLRTHAPDRTRHDRHCSHREKTIFA